MLWAMLARAQALLDPLALRGNLAALSERAGVPLILPLKANAYGHGLAEVARMSADAPQLWGYAVALPQEAAELVTVLRGLGQPRPVLLLTPPAPGEWNELSELGVHLPVASLDEARALPRGARAHLKVDTGMNRLGARPEAAWAIAAELQARGSLTGLYTHLARADEPDPSSARAQLDQFAPLVAAYPQAHAHAANGAGILSLGAVPGLTLARPGLAAYGYPPPHLRGVLPLRPVMTLRGRVGAVRTVRAGESVSYGGLWTAHGDTEVATVQLGYADGYPRAATGHAWAQIAGERRAVLGRICMDQFMLDVQGLGVRPGDWAEVWGGLPGLGASEVGEWGGVIEYELLTGVGARVQRIIGEVGGGEEAVGNPDSAICGGRPRRRPGRP
jgi:alanine racemase